MSGGPVSVSGPHPPIDTTPRLAPKARTGRQADPRRSPHQGPGGASLPAPSIRKRAEPGVSAKPPQKRQTKAKRHPDMDLSHAIPSKADRKPEAPAKAANRGEGGTEGKEGKEEGKEKRGKEARKQESRKAGKQEAGKRGSREAGKRGSWEAGSRKAGKPESGEAGKRGSREAGGGIKKRRRTVGCTSACGSQRSLAYRNYLLR